MDMGHIVYMYMLTSPEYQRHQEIFYYRINPDTQTITEPTQRYNKGTVIMSFMRLEVKSIEVENLA